MKNIEKYRNVVLENLNNCSLEKSLRELYGEKVVCCPHTNCDECKKRLREWLLEEAKEPILDDVEKKYLSAVIKPFRSRVKYIVKIISCDEFEQCIEIAFYNGYCTYLPYFKANTMYKGMEVNKEYSLEELGL